MPKFSTSTRHSSHQDGKKKSKHRGHQYHDATRARKIKQTRFKGIVEEIVDPVESGKPRPLKRTSVVDIRRFGRKIQANRETSKPVSVPIIPAEVYQCNPVNPNVPRVIIPTSEATEKRKKATATDDDGDTTDVDDSDDLLVVPAGFVEVAEMLGLLNPSPASSGHHDEPEEPQSAPEQEKPPVAERHSTRIETPLNAPPLAVPQTCSSAPSSSSTSSHMAPEPVNSKVVNNNSQTGAATTLPTYFELSEHIAPISMPHTTSVPESFQAASSSVPQFQHSAFWQNNMNNAETFHFHQQDIQNGSYLGSTDDDVNMEFLDETTVELPVYSKPTMSTSSQPQTEQQMFYAHVDQVAGSINEDRYQTYITSNIHSNWASVPMQNESVERFAQTSQPQLSYPTDPFTAATRFWMTLSELAGTSQSPTIIPDIIKSTPTQSDEQSKPSEPSMSTRPIYQESVGYVRQYRPDDDKGYHPFPNLRRCKNMKSITTNGELGEPQIVRPTAGHCRAEKPALGSEMDLKARLKREAEGLQMRHRKRRHEDSQPEVARTSKSRRRRRCETDASKLKTPIPAQKNSRKLRIHRQRDDSLKDPTSSRPQAPTEWSLSRFCPTISSLADRLFKFF